MLAAEAERLSAARREMADSAEARIKEESEMADALIAEAQGAWRAQVEAGVVADTEAHHEGLLASELLAHQEALERAEATTAQMVQLRATCEAALDPNAHRAALSAAEQSRSVSTAEEVAQRTSSKLLAASAEAERVREATRAAVRAAEDKINESVLGAQRSVHGAVAEASCAHTVLLERAGRERHAKLLEAAQRLRATRAEALVEARAHVLRSQEAQVRMQTEAEVELGAQVAGVVAQARERHEGARAAERSAFGQLTRSWLAEDGEAHAEREAAALGWQRRGSERFSSQLAATWCRQRVHHANLCRETQRARRAAFETRRAERYDALAKLEASFGLEQLETDGAMRAARRALAEEVHRLQPRYEHAAQRSLDAIAAERVGDVHALLELGYAAAAQEEAEVTAEAAGVLEASASSTSLLLAEVSASAPAVLGPSPADYAAHALRAALRASEADASTEASEAWEAAEQAAARDELERAVAEGLALRRQRAREAEADTALRAAAREAADAHKQEEEAVAALAAEEGRLSAEGGAELAAALPSRGAQAELEWDARQMGAAAAAEARLRAARTVHAKHMRFEEEILPPLAKAPAEASIGELEGVDTHAAAVAARAQAAALGDELRAVSAARRMRSAASRTMSSVRIWPLRSSLKSPE